MAGSHIVSYQILIRLASDDKRILAVLHRNHCGARNAVIIARHGVVVRSGHKNRQYISPHRLRNSDIFLKQISAFAASSGDCADKVGTF